MVQKLLKKIDGKELIAKAARYAERDIGGNDLRVRVDNATVSDGKLTLRQTEVDPATGTAHESTVEFSGDTNVIEGIVVNGVEAIPENKKVKLEIHNVPAPESGGKVLASTGSGPDAYTWQDASEAPGDGKLSIEVGGNPTVDTGFSANSGMNITVVIPNASDEADGVMSVSDKEKLDAIESGAQVNVQSDWNQEDTEQADFIKNKPDLTVYATNGYVDGKLETKQDTIEDLDDIRAGAAAGATAVQPDAIEPLATRDELETGLGGKQDKLTAGDNITIDENNVISATAAPQEQADWNQADSTAVDFIKNKPDLTVYATNEYVDGKLSEKQDAIEDLDDIRTGAAAGATAVQPDAIEPLATRVELENGLAGKQNTLTAGENITIGDDGVISAASSVQLQADWNQNDETTADFIKNKPNLSIYVTTGELDGKLATKQDSIDDLPAIRSGAALGSTAVQPAVLDAYATNEALDAGLAGKQETIADLDTIRTGAGAGSTAVQPGDLDSYAKITYVDQSVGTKQDAIADLDTIRTGADAGSTAVQPETLEDVLGDYATKAALDTKQAKIETIDDVPSIKNKMDALDATDDALHLADEELQNQIDAIVSKSDVVDIVGTHYDLEHYDPSRLGDNDIVKVLSDETHDNAETYNRWSLPESGSGEWVFVGKLGPFATKSEATYTAGDGISISAGHVISATGEANVQSDWLEEDSTSPAFIKNKPEPPVAPNDTTITISMNGSTKGTFTTNASVPKTINLGTVVTDVSGKADKVTGGTYGHLASIGVNGNLADSGKAASDFAAAEHGHSMDEVDGLDDALLAKQDTLVAGRNITIVGKTISADVMPQVQADWGQVDSGEVDFIKNKPENLVQDADYVHTDSNYTAEDKAKLTAIEDGAQVNVQSDWNASSGDAAILNKPTIPDAANDATLNIKMNGVSKGTFTADASSDVTIDLGNVATDIDLSGKADKVSGGITGDFASLDANGNLVDSGKTWTSFATAEQGGKADSAVQDSNYVHTDNNYTAEEKAKLTGIEEGAQANVQSDWNATTGDAVILNKPTIPDAANDATLTVKMNGVSKGTFTADASEDMTIDLGTVITEHQDISGKEDSANKVSSWSSVPTDTSYPSEKLVKDSLDAKAAKVIGGTAGNFASLDSAGNISDSGKSASSFADATHTHTTDDITDFPDIPSSLSDLSDDSTHRLVTDTEKSTWSGKQDAISDISTIRTNAADGETAYGWGDHSEQGYLVDSDITGKEDSSNKVTTLDDSDTHYPSSNAVLTEIQGVRDSLDEINALVPEEASTENQLADKEYVDTQVTSLEDKAVIHKANPYDANKLAQQLFVVNSDEEIINIAENAALIDGKGTVFFRVSPNN